MKNAPDWGFTRGERHAILLICAAILIGIGYRLYQQSFIPEPAATTAQDSAAIAAIREASKSQVAALQNQAKPDTSAALSGDSADPLDLNGATQAQLEALPGIGPVLARRILEARSQLGGFQRLEELLEVPGIGRIRLEQIRQRIICGPRDHLINSNPK